MKLELQKIGDATGVILPEDLLTRLGFKPGDELFVTELADGLTLKRPDLTFAHGMEIARAAMKTYNNALQELAK